MYEELVDTLADLHSIDPQRPSSATFGSPAIISSARSHVGPASIGDSQTDYIIEMERLISFLPETLPEQARTSSSMATTGSTMSCSTRRDIDRGARLGVATLGDPLADFSYLAMQWICRPTVRRLGGLDLDQLGIPSLQGYRRRAIRSARACP